MTPEKEPAFIRDITAGGEIRFDVSNPEKLAEVCAGIPYHCEFCGEKFPIWPVSEWAKHAAEKHADEMTLQNQQAIALLCSEGLTVQTVQWFQVKAITMVEIRRRAWAAGVMILGEAEKLPTRSHIRLPWRQ